MRNLSQYVSQIPVLLSEKELLEVSSKFHPYFTTTNFNTSPYLSTSMSILTFSFVSDKSKAPPHRIEALLI
jgi:hypothetical protein